MRLINSIANKDFVEADSILSETVELIMARKLEEAKKMCAAKMSEQQGHVMNRTAAKLRSMDVVEEDRPHQLNALEKIKDAEVTRKVNTLTDIKNTLNSTDKALNVLGVKSDSTDSNKIQGQIDAIRKTRPYNEELEEDEEQLDEARIKIIKARIRGGKIQRRKRVSNVPGMTLRSGKLQRMSPAERRRRKMGARKAKIKRRSKMNRALMKRQRSIRKRKALGL